MGVPARLVAQGERFVVPLRVPWRILGGPCGPWGSPCGFPLAWLHRVRVLWFPLGVPWRVLWGPGGFLGDRGGGPWESPLVWLRSVNVLWSPLGFTWRVLGAPGGSVRGDVGGGPRGSPLVWLYRVGFSWFPWGSLGGFFGLLRDSLGTLGLVLGGPRSFGCTG